MTSIWKIISGTRGSIDQKFPILFERRIYLSSFFPNLIKHVDPSFENRVLAHSQAQAPPIYSELRKPTREEWSQLLVISSQPWLVKTVFYNRISRSLRFFSFYEDDEDEKSPSHRISQLDICACIHHLPRLRVIAIPFPSRIYSDWFSLAVLFTTISKNSPLNFSSGQKCIFRAQSNEIVRLFFRKKNF